MPKQSKKMKKELEDVKSFLNDEEDVDDLLSPDSHDSYHDLENFTDKIDLLTDEIYDDVEDDEYYTSDEKQSIYMMQKIHLKVSQRNKKLNELIDQLKQLMVDGDSVAIIVPRINEIIEVQVKNDAILLKVFEILKRTSVEKHKLLLKEKGNSNDKEEHYDFMSTPDHTDIEVDY